MYRYDTSIGNSGLNERVKRERRKMAMIGGVDYTGRERDRRVNSNLVGRFSRKEPGG